MILSFFTSIGSLIIFIIILCATISIHELGHLIVAKKCNVYCYEYSIGFGPALYTNKKRETYFVLRAIPLGGFVRMAGEEGQTDEKGEAIKDNNGNPIPSSRLMAATTKGRKILIMAAGGIMNMLLALVCFYAYIVYNGGFQAPVHDSRVYVSTSGDYQLVNEEIVSGDYIIKIETSLNDGLTYSEDITKYDQINKILNKTYPQEVGDVQYITITYKDVSDNNQVKTISTNRSKVSEDSITMLGLSQYYISYDYNALSAIYGTFHFMGVNTVETFRAFGKIFTGDLSNLSGLVGIYEVVDDVNQAKAGFIAKLFYYIYFTGAISFSLGFFNLIPFPALDGGRIFFALIEVITKKKVNPNVEAMIHFIGLILLFGLMIFINMRDLIGLF